MLFPCLLLSILSTVARSYTSPYRPTCEQLREFWDEISQMSQAAETTNKIPILPPKVQIAMDHVLRAAPPFKNARRGKPYKKMLKEKSPYYLDIGNPFFRYSLPEQPLSSPANSILSKQQQAPFTDVFGEFHEEAADEQNIGPSKPHQATKLSDRHHTKPEVFMLEASSGVPSGSRKNDEIDYFIPQWGSPEEVDTFGSFVDVDFSSPMTRTPKGGDNSQWSDISQEERSQKCDAVINSDCRIDEECYCKGARKLTCIQGKCASKDNREDVGAKYGIWHDGPIPHSQLARRQRRSYRPILM